jgi:superfamily II DNA or RNA helicase
MTKVIDNSVEKLASALCSEFNTEGEIAIASAYFNVHGYGALKNGLADKPLLFLLGREPTESIKWEEEVLEELEEKEDDMNYFTLLQDAIKFFEDPSRQIRIPNGPFFHGKAYICACPTMKAVRSGVGVVGSSNFTYGGLVSNRELNMMNTDREVIQELSNWFLEQWNNSEDFKDTFLSYLKNYVTTRSPYEVIAKALYETYKSNIEAITDNRALKSLYAHQVLSYRDATLKLQKFDGVLIADATGLGKSRTALALALDARRDGKKVLLIAPKSILETTWRDEMKKTDNPIEAISTEKLSSDPDYVLKEYSDRDFLIVDEAHYFRSPSTNRYASLRELIIRNNAQVVLATATPVNNSLMDLYNLFSLYLKEDCVSDICSDTLKGYFTSNQKRWLHHQKLEMEEVLERFIVRHSREMAKALDREGKLSFPDRILDDDPRDKYSTEINYPRIDKILGLMHFTFYDMSVDKVVGPLRMPDGTPLSRAVEERNRESLKKLIKTIITINIFKRLESSTEAFKTTLKTIDEYIVNAVKYAKQKRYFVPPALKGDLIIGMRDEDEEEADLLPEPEELFSKPKYANIMDKLRMTPKEVTEFEIYCNRDRKNIKQLIDMIPPKDKKYETFRDRLADIVKLINPASRNGVLIFSQYAATSTYLHERLKQENLGLPIMLITGQACRDQYGNSADKTEIIREFQRSGGMLVSTDVLSAGQNLQNAQYVVNYDFPWNPVVLIQRIGRIDRMGSDHEEVYVINILPKNGDPDDPTSLEFFIGLMSKLYLRLEAIRETIGLDASTLGEEAAPRDFGIQQAIAKNDPTILAILEAELEQFTSTPMDALAKIMNERGLEWLRSLSQGIGAYKQGDREGLFILFTDGDEFFWRLKYKGQKETVTSPNEIINTMLKGEIQNSGDMIHYETLIDSMKTMKNELKADLESRLRREKTISGTAPKATTTIKQIYDELAKSGAEGEKLAIAFRKASNRQNIVSALQKARREGNLTEKAKELLTQPDETIIEPPKEKEIKLKRMCWCWIQEPS